MQEVPEETGLTPAPVTEAELAELDDYYRRDDAHADICRLIAHIRTLSAENAQLLRVLAGWKQEAHESVEIIHRLEAENAGLRAALDSIAQYPQEGHPRRTEDGYPAEACYDEFAYKRMVDSYRDAAAAAYSTTPGAGDKKGNGE